MGVIFSAGWTPCIGPIYGSILTMAAMGGDVATAGSLLLAYSLGLGIPFVAAAFLLDGAQGILRHLQRHLHKIELVSGAFLVLIGVLVASGRLQDLSQNFATQFADFSYNLEDCVDQAQPGQISARRLSRLHQHQRRSDNSRTCHQRHRHQRSADCRLCRASSTSLPTPPRKPRRWAGNRQHRAGLQHHDRQRRSLQPCRSARQSRAAQLLGDLVRALPRRNARVPESLHHAKPIRASRSSASTMPKRSRTSAGFRAEFGLTFPLLLDSDAQIQDLYAHSQLPQHLRPQPRRRDRRPTFWPADCCADRRRWSTKRCRKQCRKINIHRL